jgi:hypothetical protein
MLNQNIYAFNCNDDSLKVKTLTEKSSSFPVVLKRTILTEGPPFVAKLMPTSVATIVSHGESNGVLLSLISVFYEEWCLQILLSFLGQSRYIFFQVAPDLFSRGWVKSIPAPTASQIIW